MTDTHLVARGDDAMPDLAQLVSNIEQGLASEDVQSRAAALEKVRSQKGLVARLLPASQVEKTMDAVTASEIERVGAHRADMLELHHRAQQELTKQAADALLQTHGVHWVTEVTRFAIGRLDRLNSDLSVAKEHFAEQMLAEDDKLARYERVPALHAKLLESYDTELQAYFDTVDELRSQFQAALKARVEQAGGTLG